MIDFEESINQIGRELVNCNFGCEGINNNRKEGIIPRGLIIDKRTNGGDKACAIVGINPGISKAPERRTYKSADDLYAAQKAYWASQLKQAKYYKLLNDFVDKFHRFNFILWTEMVKCENFSKNAPPPIQTFRCCTQKYLNRELDLFPADFPLFAIGRKTFDALSYIYRKRTVFGVPHPTGSKGNTFNNIRIKTVPADFLNLSKGKAIWLPNAL